MSINISIFDFFSHTIPGSLYIFTIIYISSVFGLLKIDFRFSDISLTQIILLAILAYLLGLVFRPIAHIWYHLFRPKELAEKVLHEFKKSQPKLNIKFASKDWPLLLAYIRVKYSQTANDIEKNKAINIMLRGVSLNLATVSIVQLIQFVQIRDVPLIVSGVFLLFLAILTIVGSIKFDKWFYIMIYEATAISNLSLSDFLNSKKVERKKIGGKT